MVSGKGIEPLTFKSEDINDAAKLVGKASHTKVAAFYNTLSTKPTIFSLSSLPQFCSCYLNMHYVLIVYMNTCRIVHPYTLRSNKKLLTLNL